MPLKGACLCGKTTIVLDTTAESQIVCHCLDCKQTSGSAFSTNVLVPMKEVTIKGPVKEFNMKVPSGNTVTRIFCDNCGSAISHKSAVFGESQAIQTGNFKDFANIQVNTELFVKDRWQYIPEIPNAVQFQGMPTA